MQTPFRSRILILAAATLLSALSAFSGIKCVDAQTSWPADLEAAVSREREIQGLAPVQSSPALRKAAQAHAEDMARAGYFALEGPPGSPTIEALLDKEGYSYTLVTEKLVRAPLDQSVESLVAGWHATPAANRSSLFFGDIRDIGVGVAESGEMRILAIVLASANGPEAVSPQAAAFAALARDPAPARAALSAAIDAQRHAWGLSPLRVDATLGEAADRHAKDLLAALIAGRPTAEVASLADLVAEQRARTGAPVETSSGFVSRQRRHAPRGNGVGESVGQLVVTDASSPAEALTTALGQTSSALRDARYRIIAVGLAASPPASAAASGHAVWVIAVATH
jgi:uncharacterized protein YkwD